MTEARQESQGLVPEILEKGDLGTSEIKEQLREKDVSFVKSYDRRCTVLFSVVALLCLLPAIAQYSGWAFLDFFARLPRVQFPPVAMVVAAACVVAAFSLEAKVGSWRKKQGGCHDAHETVVIIREGPYGIIRHPGYLAEITYFGLLPVALSEWLPFTVLAAVYYVAWLGALAYLVRAEDAFNIRKWGEEYRQYVREVPALNLLKGLRQRRSGIATR